MKRHYVLTTRLFAANIPKVFNRADGKEFGWVINCFGRWEFGNTDEFYEVKIKQPSIRLAMEAAKRRVPAFVELSGGWIYGATPGPATEETDPKPVYKLIRYKLQVEQAFRDMEGLNYVTLRSAVPYGSLSSFFLGKIACMARISKERDEPLVLLGSGEAKLSSVWIYDVARALIHAADWRAKQGPLKAGDPVAFNLVDHNNTNQATIAESLSRCFNMKVEFFSLPSLVARSVHFDSLQALEETNHTNLMGWNDLLQNSNIAHTPLSPYLDQDVLREGHFQLDGSLFEKTTGFRYERPHVPKDFIREMVESYKEVNWWP